MARNRFKSDGPLAAVQKAGGQNGRDYFPKVRQAREALAEKAKDILQQYLDVIQDARDAGNVEVAAESLQWLMEHMPEVENERMIDVHIDRQALEKAPVGPSINIGFQLGGMPALNGGLPAVVEVETLVEEAALLPQTVEVEPSE